MHLQKHLVPAILDRSANGSVGRPCRAEVKKVDAVVDCFTYNGFDLICRCLSDTAQDNQRARNNIDNGVKCIITKAVFGNNIDTGVTKG